MTTGYVNYIFVKVIVNGHEHHHDIFRITSSISFIDFFQRIKDALLPYSVSSRKDCLRDTHGAQVFEIGVLQDRETLYFCSGGEKLKKHHHHRHHHHHEEFPSSGGPVNPVGLQPPPPLDPYSQVNYNVPSSGAGAEGLAPPAGGPYGGSPQGDPNLVGLQPPPSNLGGFQPPPSNIGLQPGTFGAPPAYYDVPVPAYDSWGIPIQPTGDGGSSSGTTSIGIGLEFPIPEGTVLSRPEYVVLETLTSGSEGVVDSTLAFPAPTNESETVVLVLVENGSSPQQATSAVSEGETTGTTTGSSTSANSTAVVGDGQAAASQQT